MMTNEIKVQSSSGNVFADLELQNPEELLIKAELVRQISRMIDTRKIQKLLKLSPANLLKN